MSWVRGLVKDPEKHNTELMLISSAMIVVGIVGVCNFGFDRIIPAAIFAVIAITGFIILDPRWIQHCDNKRKKVPPE